MSSPGATVKSWHCIFLRTMDFSYNMFQIVFRLCAYKLIFLSGGGVVSGWRVNWAHQVRDHFSRPLEPTNIPGHFRHTVTFCSHLFGTKSGHIHRHVRRLSRCVCGDKTIILKQWSWSFPNPNQVFSYLNLTTLSAVLKIENWNVKFQHNPITLHKHTVPIFILLIGLTCQLMGTDGKLNSRHNSKMQYSYLLLALKVRLLWWLRL